MENDDLYMYEELEGKFTIFTLEGGVMVIGIPRNTSGYFIKVETASDSFRYIGILHIVEAYIVNSTILKKGIEKEQWR